MLFLGHTKYQTSLQLYSNAAVILLKCSKAFLISSPMCQSDFNGRVKFKLKKVFMLFLF